MKATGKKEKGADYYDKVYSKPTSSYKESWTKSRYINLYKKIIEAIPEKESKIIDAGCGTGQLLAMLGHYGYKRAIGFDYSKTAIELAKKIFPDISCAPADLFETNYNGFDVVIMTEVMEHIESDELLLRNVTECVPMVIISVPSFDDPAHVRYFEGTHDVGNRYGKYFKDYTVEKIGPWFLLIGKK